MRPARTGLATAAALGTSNISATLNGVTSPSSTLTVTAATLVSIAVTPASRQHRERPDAAVHRHRHLHGQFYPGPDRSGDLGILRHRRWRPSATRPAPMASSRRASGSARPTSARLTAASPRPLPLSACTAATLVSIQVSPSSAIIANGSTQPYTATGTYTDNSTQDLTAVATWASSSTAVADHQQCGRIQRPRYLGGRLGSTNISATYTVVTSPSAMLDRGAGDSGRRVSGRRRPPPARPRA